MNHKIIFIIAVFLVLLLHSGTGILMIQDEKNRIKKHQTIANVTLIPTVPDSTEEIIAETEQEKTEQEQEQEFDIELPKEAQTSPQAEETSEESSEQKAEEETQEQEAEKPEDVQEEETQQEPEVKPPSYQQNLSQEGESLKNSLLPPREDGGFSRTVSTEKNPYGKMVDEAIALLADTPFLDGDWNQEPIGVEDSTYFSPEFLDHIRKSNMDEPINREEVVKDEPPAPTEAEIAEEDIFGSDQPVTMIVHHVLSPEEKATLEQEAKKQEELLEAKRSTNIINTAGSQIRRLEYNLSLASNQCFEKYIRKSNRRHSITLIIFEYPTGVTVRVGSGNAGLDQCIVEMTEQFIAIPAEMDRIRKYAPRLTERSYLLNANF
ncbi:hypothetical protein [Ignatzschineria sp. LJL83]